MLMQDSEDIKEKRMTKIGANQAAKVSAAISQTRWSAQNVNSISDFEKARRSNFQGIPKPFPGVHEDEEVEDLIESYLKYLWS